MEVKKKINDWAMCHAAPLASRWMLPALGLAGLTVGKHKGERDLWGFSSRSIEKETCTCLPRVSYGSYVISVYPFKAKWVQTFRTPHVSPSQFSEEADWHWKQDTFDLKKLGNMETSWFQSRCQAKKRAHRKGKQFITCSQTFETFRNQ